MQPDDRHEAAESSGPVPGPTAEACDPVLEVFKRDIDFTLVERNRQLTTEERAQQLVNATRRTWTSSMRAAPKTSAAWRLHFVLTNHTFDQPRVTDFGLARGISGDSELTLTGQVLGSPNYLPPEQAAGRPAGVGSDIYSLRAIL